MGKVTESISTVNAFIRTILATIVLGAVGYGSFLGYEYLVKPQIEASQRSREELETTLRRLEETGRELSVVKSKVNEQQQVIASQTKTIEQQTAEIAQLAEEKEKLEIAKRLLKVDHRLARVKVLSVGTNTETGEAFSDVEFTELADGGEVLGEPRRFRLSGDEIRVDSWIVKFDDQYIEQADLLRGTSLCVFKSIHGNLDAPTDAHQLEEPNSRPAAYGRGGPMSEFEKKIWADFWEISTDPEKALELGIRAGHGQVNYVKAKEGLTYEIDLRASDGMTIRPLREEPPESTP